MENTGKIEFEFGRDGEIREFRGIILDDFQNEAVSYLHQGYDVLVSAPTGSGKTLIAEIRIKEVLMSGGRCWYASPLKALSNDKYREFRKIYGAENVGILTGDRRENVKAPIIVGTTEIFRNIIIEEGINGEIDVSFIVFDEAHWIADKERGVSWEEAIIFSPKRAQLLLLSATFPNVEEIALWISSVRMKEVRVVQKTERPVPLLWFSIGDEIKPLIKNGENFDTKIMKKWEEIEIIENRTKFSVPKAVYMLRKRGATPAIFFFSSRKECEENALEIAKLVETKKLKIVDEYEIEKRAEFSERYFEVFPYIKDDIFVQNFIKTGIAPHHAGLLPSLKVFFEDALKEGLAQCIFATKTLASGIDVPARSVVIVSKLTFDGERERLLSPSEIAQMSGRAGRRGKDEVGYVFISAPVGQEVRKFFGDMEPIRSSFYITPHLVLNLLKTLEKQECINLVRKSLKYFELAYLIEKWEKKKKETEEKLYKTYKEFENIKPQDKNCTYKNKIDYLNTYENIKNSKKRIDNLNLKIEIIKKILEKLEYCSEKNECDEKDKLEREWKSRKNEEEGKELIDGGESEIVFAVDERGKFGVIEEKQNGVISIRGFGYNKVIKDDEKRRKIRYTIKVELEKENITPKFIIDEILIHLQSRYRNISDLVNSIKSLVDKFEKIKRKIEEKNRRRENELKNFPCYSCPSFSECTPISKRIKELEDNLAKIIRENPDEVEKEFTSMIDFLRHLGYIDENDILTEKGWEASQIKNPRSIYIFEALHRKVVDTTSPEVFSAYIALLLSEARPPFRKPPEKIEKLVEEIYNLEVKFKLTPKVRPAEIFVRRRKKRWSDIANDWRKKKLAFLDGKIYEAVLLWAKGYSIDEVEEETGVEMGDLSRMVTQTVEVLRQIEKIYDYRYIAKQSIQKIYRSPISDFVE